MALFSKKHSQAPRRRQPSQVERATESSLEERYSFRRNRTLTGSASSKVVSTGEDKAQLKSTRVQAHELTKKRRHIGGMLLIVLLGSSALYGLIMQFTASASVRSQDLTLKLDGSYGQIIQSYFASQPIERLRFLINTDHLSEFVQAKAPEVASVKVEGSGGFGKSIFKVTLREPLAGWSMNNRQQYVDSSGTAFERNYFAPPALQIVDNSGVQVRAGRAVASNSFLGFVGRAVGLAKGHGYKVTQVIIPTGTTREVDLRLDGVAYPIKLSVDRLAGEQVEDMARAVKWLQAHPRTLEYLDVRVRGEAFYR